MAAKQPSPSPTLLELSKWEQRLQKQILEAKMALEEASVPDDQLNHTEEEMEKLKADHEEAFVRYANASSCVERIQLTTEALKVIFPDGFGEQPEGGFHGVTEKSARLQDAMARQQDLIRVIMDARDSIEERKMIVNEFRQKNQALRQQNRRTMLGIKEAQQAHGNRRKQRILKAEKDLQTAMDRITVQSNVFQALIVGSGVNWAQDEELLNLVIKLGKNSSNLNLEKNKPS